MFLKKLEREEREGRSDCGRRVGGDCVELLGIESSKGSFSTLGFAEDEGAGKVATTTVSSSKMQAVIVRLVEATRSLKISC